MSRKIIFVKYFALGILFTWSLILLVFGVIEKNDEYSYAEKLALNEAQVSVKKDLAYRAWVSSHGGVYVPITERTPPNPYLSHIPSRDVTTDDGQKLTLMNPAYTLSQMMRDYSDLYGVKAHITSNILLNPKNKPDTWESSALDFINSSKQPFYEIQLIDNEPFYRLLNPLITVPDCLKCHGHQGYKVGDVRGGVSVAIPLSPYYEDSFSQLRTTVIFILFIWLVGVVAIYLGYRKIEQYVLDKVSNYEQHIFSMVDMIENRDSYTAGHTKRVAEYASLIATQMGYNPDIIEKLYRASMVHDIGKISTPDSILLKPGKLSGLEYKLIQRHVTTGYNLLKNVDIFDDIAEIVRHHHEHYDGSGYPEGLTGDQIPMLSQIMSVADAFDAMTTDRVYKGKKSVDFALEELQLLSGKQFHSEIVEFAFLALKNVEAPVSSQLPKDEIEQERFAYFYKDQLTGVYNQDYLNFILISNNDNDQQDAYRCINLINLKNFTQYNKQFSWKQGNELLINIAQRLNQLFPDALIIRIHGDDFVVLHKTHLDIKQQLSQVDDVLDGTGVLMSQLHLNLQSESINSVDELERWLLSVDTK
ncbi:MAG: DUF3365 domain-containing protein [Gammaproteobacteria bacterium]|jgi:diguanylate cyclase (GGDEF)-like protein/putative nucleotidyltransferase with HDIG domain|nr:DUF3365 domain-containing protein [Gammaproteobacteria bacterium]MBT3724368.1 DUF3365 domain-containing protein [Gammaproteobacteria bacterium]MBT4077020.1 DUF3365 domain-containing protein [Gammaproteobacteria bacterium]MBT4194053.1 DUF3365 domain-containing protein [Gammaproteobacteria bacterium]MBT4452072.1 DUF3365 domain-containing protein [Gammaproteobacteria bacterium]